MTQDIVHLQIPHRLTLAKQLRTLGSMLLPPNAATSPSWRGIWIQSWTSSPNFRWSVNPFVSAIRRKMTAKKQNIHNNCNSTIQKQINKWMNKNWIEKRRMKFKTTKFQIDWFDKTDQVGRVFSRPLWVSELGFLLISAISQQYQDGGHQI